MFSLRLEPVRPLVAKPNLQCGAPPFVVLFDILADAVVSHCHILFRVFNSVQVVPVLDVESGFPHLTGFLPKIYQSAI